MKDRRKTTEETVPLTNGSRTFERAHNSESAEVRYRVERNPDHGFGPVPYPKGIHELDLKKCVHLTCYTNRIPQ